jgi:hypothetical protein
VTETSLGSVGCNDELPRTPMHTYCQEKLCHTEKLKRDRHMKMSAVLVDV